MKLLENKRKLRSLREFLYILPFLALVAIFSYYPLYGWFYAFFDYKPPFPLTWDRFVGLKWFQTMVSNKVRVQQLLSVLRNTFAVSGLSLAFSWFPMMFAVFLNEIKSTGFKKFVQTVTTLPNFISWVLVYSIAFAIFSSTGAVNTVAMSLGLYDEPKIFLASSDHIWFKMWLWLTWKNAGWAAIMYIAAIAGIDEELITAAKVDGASRMKIIWHITIPSLLPTYFVIVMLNLANFLSNGFEQFYVFQNAFNKEYIQVLDLYVYNLAMGSGRVFGIGSGVDDEKFLRIMEFLDWYASPDGLEYQHIGIEGFNYTRGADGKLTIKNENALMDNLPVPEEWGGGGFNDGNNAINQWIVDAISTNPKTGEPYSRTYWSTYKAATQTEMKRQWAEKFGANEPAEWMKKNGKLTSEFFSVPQVETMDEFRKMATEMFAEDADEFLALCDAQSGNIEEVRKKASVSGLEYSIRIAAQANDQSKTGVPIYYYNFDAEIPGWDNPGTFHSVDLWFTFETLAKCWRPFTGKHYDLARQICNYWCNFIRSGDPNGKDSTGEEMERWEPYTTDAPYCMVFGDTPKFVREQPGDLMKFLVDQYFKRRF